MRTICSSVVIINTSCKYILSSMLLERCIKLVNMYHYGYAGEYTTVIEAEVSSTTLSAGK